MAFPVPSAPWYAAALVVGVLVTVVAAWLPTRRVVRVNPLAALRPDDSASVHTGAGRLRVLLGLVVVAVGVALLALSISASNAVAMVLGGVASFSGVLLLGPVVVPALIRAVGGPVGRVAGAPVRLATENAVRNPRRTAATTASLLVGVTLTTAVLVGLASSRSAVDDDLDRDYPVDVTLTATDAPLAGDVLDEGPRGAGRLVGARAGRRLRQRRRCRPAAGGRRRRHRRRGARRARHGRPAAGEIWLPSDLMDDLADGDSVAVRVGGRSERLTVRGGSGWGEAAVVAPSTLAGLTTSPEPWAVWVRAALARTRRTSGATWTRSAQSADADLVNSLKERSWVTLQLDILTGTVVALLGIAVVIALIGIGNTLGLSVLERGRENALLRALGLTRRQLRATLAAEALLLSVVATVLGTAIGVTFAWVAVHALVQRAVDAAPMVLPWGQLSLVVLIAGVAGLLVGPAAGAPCCPGHPRRGAQPGLRAAVAAAG